MSTTEGRTAPLSNYLVTWDMEFEAENPTEAAKLAHEVMLDPNSTATFFTVTDGVGVAVPVDLFEDDV